MVLCSSSSWTWSWLALVGVRLLSAAGAVCARVPPVSHGGFWKNFLFYVAYVAGLVALFALGNLDFSTFALVSFSPCGFGCCLWSNSYWIFLDACFFLVQQWIHFLRACRTLTVSENRFVLLCWSPFPFDPNGRHHV